MTRLENEASARVLGAMLRQGISAEKLDDERLEVEARRLVERARFERSEGRGVPWRRALLAASVFIMLLVGTLGLWTLRERDASSVAWTVEGRASVQGESVKALTEPVTLRFSEGSRIELAPEAEVRVSELEESGARLTVLGGKVASRIVHRTTTHYRVQAGPYEVSVVGTEFETEWTPESQSLRVTMLDGSVEVRGAGIAGLVTLTKGQRFEASGETREWAVAPVDAPPTVENEPRTPEVVNDGVDGERESSAKPEPTSKRASTKESGGWPAAIAKGDFARVLAEARAMGVERCLASCGAKDLRALGDAARYRGDFAVARSALGALRERVPGERARASYLLGTLGEAQGDARSALGWYRRSIAESPAGPLAAEARAGALRVTLALEGRGAARPLAEEYLRLYPDGVGAETARRILGR